MKTTFGKTIFDVFGDDIDRMIELNKRFRKNFAKISETISPVHYAAECCTVRVDIGRRTGKTTYIAVNAGPEDLVLVANPHIKHMVEERYGLAAGVTIMTGNELDMVDSSTAYRHYDLTQFKTIYVDEPRLVFANLLQHRMYSILANSEIEQTFVLLGN
jgi:hypothetical protein